MTASGRPLGRQGWWLRNPDNESRAFVLAAVALALTTWDVSFQLGVYGEIFFEKCLTIRVAATTTFLACTLLGKRLPSRGVCTA